MKKIFIILCLSIIAYSCGTGNQSVPKEAKQSEEKKFVQSDDTPDGYYTNANKDGDLNVEITVSGDSYEGIFEEKSLNISEKISGKVSGRNLLGYRLPYEKIDDTSKKEVKVVGQIFENNVCITYGLIYLAKYK